MSYDTPNPIESLALSVLESLGGRISPSHASSNENHALATDYYAALDVDRRAPSEDILVAIQRLRTGSTPLTFHVKEALDNAEFVLLTPELRARYDATLNENDH